MVNPDTNLVNYIWTYLHQGYSLTSIRDSLSKQGYSKKDINSAIDYIYANYYYSQNSNSYKSYNPQVQTTAVSNSSKKPTSHKSILALFGILAIFLIIVSFSVVFFMNNSDADYDTSYISTDDSLDSRFDYVSDSYESSVDDSNIKNPIDEVDLDSQNSENLVDDSDLNIPDVKPITKSVGVNIEDDFDKNVDYSYAQIQSKVNYFSETNPKEALKFCNYYDDDVKKYYCYQDIAKISENIAFCRKIPIKKYKDDCFFSSVLDDFNSGSACDLIEDSHKKQTCLRIVDLNNQANKLEQENGVMTPDKIKEKYAKLASNSSLDSSSQNSNVSLEESFDAVVADFY